MTQKIDYIFDIIGNALASIVGFISSLWQDERKTTFDADFSKPSDIASIYNKGFSINGKHYLKANEGHVLLLGSSGTGKSVAICIPGIFRTTKHSTVLVHDPSGELYTACSSGVKANGSDNHILAYNRPNISIRYNLLKRATTTSAKQKVSRLMVGASSSGKRDFWEISSEMALTLILRILAFCDPQYNNMYNANYIVKCWMYNDRCLDRIVAQTNDKSLITDYKAFINYEKKVLQNILSSLSAALAIFNDPDVAYVTSGDTIDIDSFRIKRQCIWIQNSVTDAKYFAPITSILFEQIWGHIMSSIPDKKSSLPINCIIDEASSLNLGSFLGVALSNLRKHLCSVLLTFQHYEQIVHLYGRSEAISFAANAKTIIYMPNQSTEVAKTIHSSMGKFECIDEETKQRKVKSLMEVEDILQCEDILIKHSINPFVRSKIYPYYEQPQLKAYAQMPAVKPIENLDLQMPPLIPLDL